MVNRIFLARDHITVLLRYFLKNFLNCHMVPYLAEWDTEYGTQTWEYYYTDDANNNFCKDGVMNRDPIYMFMGFLCLAVIGIFGMAFTVGCGPVPEFPTPSDKPSIKLLTYEELSGGINAGIIEVVDTEEQFLFIRSYDNSMAIVPLERNQDISRIGK